VEFGQIGITAGAGVFGVVLGTITRPYFEEWFARRKKTLHVIVYEPSEFRAPHDSVVLSWRGEPTDRIIQSGFRLENRTGRTLRNFRLEIGANVAARDDQLYAVYLESSAKARFSSNNSHLSTQYLFELMEPNAMVSGSFLSSYPVGLQVIALDDLEIRSVIPAEITVSRRILEKMSVTLMLMTVMMSIVASFDVIKLAVFDFFLLK
jgi:hypothetical protein